jgi:hypothetical protein
MDEIRTLNNPDKSSQPLSKELTEVWKQLEEQVRQRPGTHLLMTFALGYFLQIIPFESLLFLAVKLARPILFLVLAFQLTKYIKKAQIPLPYQVVFKKQ